MKLKKYHSNPILLPNPENSWESVTVCNPGVWYEDGKFYLLYRAAGNDYEHHIHLGLAESYNGFDFERVSTEPVLSPSKENHYDAGTVEDPRIVKFSGKYFITYACVPYYPGQYWLKEDNSRYLPEDFPDETPVCIKENKTRTGLLISKDLRTFVRAGYLTDPMVDDRDVIIFPEKIKGKFVTLHRPAEWAGDSYSLAFGLDYPGIWIAFSDDLLEQKNLILLAKAEQPWERKIGGSTPPIKTDKGWLMLYHAVDDQKTYRVGAMMLDLDDPTKIIGRTKDFIMEPETEFEKNGLYKFGVVFPTGNVVKDGTLYVYYGCSDKYIGVATADLNELVDFVLQSN